MVTVPSATNVIQRFPQPFNDYNDAESYNPLKTHETPPQKCYAAGFAYVIK